MLTQQFSTEGDFAPQWIFGNIWRHFWLSQQGHGGATGIWWIEAKGTAKNPTMLRIALDNKE